MKVIYCAGNQGRVVLDILRRSGRANDVVFADDDLTRRGGEIDGIPIVGDLEDVIALDHESVCVLIAFGARQGVRLDVARRVEEADLGFFEAVDPSATISNTADVGVGVTINAESYVGPDAAIGNHVLVDSSANISHDVSLGRGVTVTPGAVVAGCVSIGADAYVGPGATVVRGVNVGSDAVVGAGAVVLDDVENGETVVGVPAEPK